jgi:hypothetical protein
VRGTTYQRLANAKANLRIETSISDYIEQLIDSDLRARGEPAVAREDVKQRSTKPAEDVQGGGFFSF